MPAASLALYVPVVIVEEFVGNVPGPVSHVTLCELEAFTHVKTTVSAAAAVSGVGLKTLLLTEMLLLRPPLPPLPVESPHAATAATLMVTLWETLGSVPSLTTTFTVRLVVVGVSLLLLYWMPSRIVW